MKSLIEKITPIDILFVYWSVKLIYSHVKRETHDMIFAGIFVILLAIAKK